MEANKGLGYLEWLVLSGSKNLPRLKENVTRDNIRDVMSIQLYDQTLLHHFIDANWHEGITYLLSIGANAEAPSKVGFTPLLRAVSDAGNTEADLETVRILITHGCDVEAVMYVDKQMYVPLRFAVEGKKKEIGQLLVNSGANPKNVKGRSRNVKWLWN